MYFCFGHLLKYPLFLNFSEDKVLDLCLLFPRFAANLQCVNEEAFVKCGKAKGNKSMSVQKKPERGLTALKHV